MRQVQLTRRYNECRDEDAYEQHVYASLIRPHYTRLACDLKIATLIFDQPMLRR